MPVIESIRKSPFKNLLMSALATFAFASPFPSSADEAEFSFAPSSCGVNTFDRFAPYVDKVFFGRFTLASGEQNEGFVLVYSDGSTESYEKTSLDDAGDGLFYYSVQALHKTNFPMGRTFGVTFSGDGSPATAMGQGDVGASFNVTFSPTDSMSACASAQAL